MKTVFKKFGFFVAGLALWAAILAPLHIHAQSLHHDGVTSDCSVCHVQAQVRYVVVNASNRALNLYDFVLATIENSQQSVFVQGYVFVSSRAPPLS